MKVTRRKFLALGGIAGVAALFGTYLWRHSDPGDIVVAILDRNLGHLRVDPASFRDFAKDYVAHQKDYEQKLRVLSPISPLLKFMNPYDWFKQGDAYRRLSDNVVSKYLLSTDFFQNGADENRPVTYLSFYDPYTAVCRNPFVKLALSPLL